MAKKKKVSKDRLNKTLVAFLTVIIISILIYAVKISLTKEEGIIGQAYMFSTDINKGLLLYFPETGSGQTTGCKVAGISKNYLFNGVNSYIECNSFKQANLKSACAWVENGSATFYAGINDAKGYQRLVYTASLGSIGVEIRNPSSSNYRYWSASHTTPYPFHVCITQNNLETPKAYINGIEYPMKVYAQLGNPSRPTGSNLWINRYSNSNNYYRAGYIKEMMIWNRVISYSEVKDIYSTISKKASQTGQATTTQPLPQPGIRQEMTINFTKGFNFINIPYTEVKLSDLQSIPNIRAIYSFNMTGYIHSIKLQSGTWSGQLTAISPKLGLIIKSDADFSHTFRGSPPEVSALSTELVKGFNLIPISQNITASEYLINNPDVRAIYKFDGQKYLSAISKAGNILHSGEDFRLTLGESYMVKYVPYSVNNVKMCVDNKAVYWFDTRGFKQSLVETCNIGCEADSCTYIKQYKKVCSSSDIYWQDSKGVINDKIQDCSEECRMSGSEPMCYVRHAARSCTSETNFKTRITYEYPIWVDSYGQYTDYIYSRSCNMIDETCKNGFCVRQYLAYGPGATGVTVLSGSPISHYYVGCEALLSKNLYYFNSEGKREELKETCANSCSYYDSKCSSDTLPTPETNTNDCAYLSCYGNAVWCKNLEGTLTNKKYDCVSRTVGATSVCVAGGCYDLPGGRYAQNFVHLCASFFVNGQAIPGSAWFDSNGQVVAGTKQYCSSCSNGYC